MGPQCEASIAAMGVCNCPVGGSVPPHQAIRPADHGGDWHELVAHGTADFKGSEAGAAEEKSCTPVPWLRSSAVRRHIWVNTIFKLFVKVPIH